MSFAGQQAVMAAAAAGRMHRLVSKFRGCMVGSLLGDCIGTPFEGEFPIAKNMLANFFKKLGDPHFQVPFFPYSDDTLMIRCVAESLLKKGEYDPADMAQRFADEYQGTDKNENVFKLLRAWKYIDVYRPAQDAYEGKGSNFNGAAVRMPPIAMFYYGDIDKVTEVALDSARLTHAHRNGFNGAVLLCAATHQALIMDPTQPLQPNIFVDTLLDIMDKVESQPDESGANDRPFVKKLEQVNEYLKSGNTKVSDIVNNLGNDTPALKSVPTAIFTFLRSLQPIPEVEHVTNPMERVIHYTVLLGLDTDTIACMAGALMGAFHGEEAMPESLLRRCEGVNDNIHLADRLSDTLKYKKAQSTN